MEKEKVGQCIDYSFDGEGIIKNESKVVFLKNCLLNEKVAYKIVYEGKDFDKGEIIKIIKPSKNRVKPVCPIYEDCGGCNLQHMNYEEQLRFKKMQVENAFKTIAKINCEINECIDMENPYYYRNKIQVPYALNDNQEIEYGFYKKGTHKIVKMSSCHLQENFIILILEKIKKFFTKHKLEVYDEEKRKGILRHVLIKRAFATNETMVVLVTNTNNLPHKDELISELTKEFPSIKTIIQNINDKNTNVVLGEKEKVLFGNGYIEDILLGVKFRISSKSFYQINPIQTEKLYKEAIKIANLNKDDIVIDAYSGIGAISLVVSKYVKHVYGVEIVKEAINDAIENAKNNQINNVTFVLDDASKLIKEFSKTNYKINAIFVDPPRKGCDKDFIETLLKMEIAKIIYISCNPATLARDINLLKGKYEVKEVQPVDMFPQTSHVETVVLMER